MKLLSLLATLAALLNPLKIPAAEAQSQTTVYFLAAGPRLTLSQYTPEASAYESFVVPVSDPDQIAMIRSLIQRTQSPVVNVRIQTGNGDGLNRDFYAPGAPAWNWSVTALISVQGPPRNFFPFCCPEPGELPEEEYGSVSMIAADPQDWIARHGTELNQQWFPLVTEVNPFRDPIPPDPETPVMANLSSRAVTGRGQDILIGGVTISGSRPKQVAVRALGNRVLNRFGIITSIGTPRVRVYDATGTQLVALKSERDYELIARFPGLMPPGFDRHGDALGIITLYPGQYTFHIFDENDRTGVVLFELYDLSFAPQPFP